MQYNFEWDPVFWGQVFPCNIILDPLQLSLLDNELSEQEERWITLGNTKSHKLSLVVHTYLTYHQDQVTVRIISARPATVHEQKQYEGS